MPHVSAGDFTAEQLLVSGNRLLHRPGGFVEKLNPEMAHAQRDHARHIVRAGLRQGVEDCVAAADIRLDRVLGADAVP